MPEGHTQRTLALAVGLPSLAEPGEHPIIPFAYYNARRETIFVRPSRRDYARDCLKAEVKDGIWHFPVHHTDPVTRKKIRKLVKAQERPLKRWDPSREPEEGDIKLTNGECQDRDVQYQGKQLGGVTPPLWYSTPKKTYGQCTGDSDRPCADRWTIVFKPSEITYFDDAACTRPAPDAAHFILTLYDWTCLEL